MLFARCGAIVVGLGLHLEIEAGAVEEVVVVDEVFFLEVAVELHF